MNNQTEFSMRRKVTWALLVAAFLVVDTLTRALQSASPRFRRSMERWMSVLLMNDPVRPGNL